MTAHGGVAENLSHVVFGWDPMTVATVVLVLTYGVIVTEKINRAIVAMLGAGLMILLGVLNQDAAIRGIDFNTLALLTGMMVIVSITRRSGVFQFLAIWAAKRVKARPRHLLWVLALVTAVASALLDNVTTVMLIVPVTLLITEELEVSAYPFLFTQIFASNVGGTATLIGDPPNILIGSAVGLSFNDFVMNVGAISFAILAVMLFLFDLIWGRRMTATDTAKNRVMGFSERDAITDKKLLKKSLLVLALVLFGFVVGHSYHQEPGTVALFGAALLMLLDNFHRDPEEQSHNVHETFGHVEWITIFFFIGLFVLVYGVEHTGLLSLLSKDLLVLTGGDLTITALAVLWSSAVFSAIVDNIPFVATMIPLIKSMAPEFGGAQGLMPLWWALSLGACLGGNGSLVGASANLMVAGFAERAGQRIKFLKFMALAFPLMLITVAIAHVYLYYRYLS